MASFNCDRAGEVLVSEKPHPVGLNGSERADLLGAEHLARVSEAGGYVVMREVWVVATHVPLGPAITKQSDNELDRQPGPPNNGLPRQPFNASTSVSTRNTHCNQPSQNCHRQ